ncbi:lipopolysaccharide biosynthesis protein [Legionella adelaidensis]|uniref:Lipopolysaccharide biosynthesis protein n=1 Tax=Legionella adelaidensis TaxID=45056 RepID=A0A0W0R4S4_9GAMM|nr:O-antigen translocase [Legionella adelaidensis]KTC66039.1 lipopolysaccharide biosynthesis protein [Legionella adelaidensis]
MKIYKDLFKTSALSGLGTLLKILTSLLSLKIVALYTGPAGVGIFGQFMAFVNVIAIIAGGGITLGVIKYVAEYSAKPELGEFLASSTCFTLIFSILTLILGLTFSTILAKWILGTEEYSYLFQLLAIAQFFIALHLLFCAIINGFEKIKKLLAINIGTSLVSMGLIIYCSIVYQTKGTLLGYILAQVASLLVSFLYVYRESWFPLLFSMKPRMKDLVSLSHYSLMNIISALTVPIAQVIVRNDLRYVFGWEAVGYWQAVVRISDAYILFVTTALTAYYLPRLSKQNSVHNLKTEIGLGLKGLMPLFGFILFVLYVFRSQIITLLYDNSFQPVQELFFYQLLGDFFRVGGWLFTYFLLAKSWTKTYIITEAILALLFIVISHFFVRVYGLIGVTYSFALTYFLYALMMTGIGLYYFKGSERKWRIVNIP